MFQPLSRRARAGLVAALATVPALALMPAAQAEDAHPYEVFRNCPAAQMVADGAGADSSCVTAVVTGGEFVIGKGSVPITADSILSLGSATIAGKQRDYSVPGKVFTSSPMQVPGGLLGVPGFGLEKLLPGVTDITATVQLATTETPVVDIFSAIYGGEVVALPVKIKLNNVLLGANCYIGSNANPIVLHLTTETTSPPAPNTPISGKLASFSYQPVGENGGSIVTAAGGVLVDNSFAVPAATGCGVGGLFNGVVNQRQGLPSPAGKNTAVLEQDSYLGGPAPDVLAWQQG